MDDSKAPALGSSNGGFVALHPEMANHVMVAPTPIEADDFNAIRPALATVACWRLDDIRFEFDSSLVLPAAAAEFTRLAELRKSYPDAPVSLFGHADPVGNEDYNKKLSGRRAQAIYAVLTRRADLWEKLYKEPFGGDTWGLKSTQILLEALGYYPGPNDGKMTRDVQRAVKNFQADAGLKDNGDPGPDTRKKLYEAYFDFLSTDEEGNPFRLDAAEFLGEGQDPDGKADYQGCSEFNPVLLFSKGDDKAFTGSPDKRPRNAANAPNRRVVAFFFRPGVQIELDKWPCPRAKEGVGGCKKRFWSDAKSRVALGDETREYKQTRDTFACRFYDRLARRSPCEAGVREWVLRILEASLDPLKDRKPLANAPFTVSGAGGGDIEGSTDAEGVLRFRATTEQAKLTLKIGGLVITLDGGALPALDDGDEGARDRLYNLGYGPDDFSTWDDDDFNRALASFQRDYGIAESEAVDEPTKAKLREVYGA